MLKNKIKHQTSKTYYLKKLMSLLNFIVPSDSVVLELSTLKLPVYKSSKSKTILVDYFSDALQTDALQKCKDEVFDYVLLPDLLYKLKDVQQFLKTIIPLLSDKGRLVITNPSPIWLRSKGKGEVLCLDTKDIINFLNISGYELIKKGSYVLIPFYVPILSEFINKYFARLPLIRKLCKVKYFVARKVPKGIDNEYSVSVIIAARNEEKNIEDAVTRIPQMGKGTEIIFVEGGSSDNTYEEIVRVAEKYKDDKDISFYKQDGKGKGDAVRKGFSNAKGDILMILDADLTVPPEDLPKFYNAIKNKQGEYIQGTRLVYPMEKESMRFLNTLGNKFFSKCFTFLLDQTIKDTLCGTKVLFKEDYEILARNRSYFGNFDPFGDFDLILGANKLNLKLVEIPITYRRRIYGTTNISRFSHGWLLLKMTLFAAKKIKFF